MINILLLPLTGLAQQQCVDLFVENSVSISAPTESLFNKIGDQQSSLIKVGFQQFYEAAILFFQKKVTVSSLRSTTAIQQRNKLNMIHFLLSGKHNEAIDIYRRVFEDVELSYWVIKQNHAYLNQLEQMSVTPEVIKSSISVKRKIRIFERRFAENYGEYIEVRKYLEDVIKSKTGNLIFQEAAANTLKYLGVHKFSEKNPDFKALNIPERRVKIEEIKELYRSGARFTRMKLWKDFKKEIISVFKYFMSSEILLKGIEGTIDRIPAPAQAKVKIKTVFGFMKSASLRNRYLPLIVDIESLPNDNRMRLEELRRKNTISASDEFLITFARTTDFSDTWNTLKAEAALRAEEPNNRVYKNFYERMLAAENKALHLGDISLFEQGSNIDVTLAIIQAGIVLYVGYPDSMPSWDSFTHAFSNILHHII